VDINKLRESINNSRRDLQAFRCSRADTIRQYVGNHYSDSGASDRVPVNFLELAINIYTQQLAARIPQVLVTTDIKELKPMAYTFELALNQLCKKINLGDTLREAVIDALFSVGIVRIGLERKAQVNIEGYDKDVGQPFCEVVSLDDWVHDTTAVRLPQCQFMGHRYRLPLEMVKESPAFKNTAGLEASQKSGINEQGDTKVESLSHGAKAGVEEYKERIDLWDIWLPFENKLITITAEDNDERVIREVDWDGPDDGPYKILSFGIVPGNIMPLAPSALWMDLHQLANEMFRKLGRQTGRQKTILGVQAGNQQDGERIKNANDGEIIPMDNPDKAKEYRFGGIDQPSLAFLLQVKDLFVYLGGNLDSLGGLAPMADTLGQDQLLAQNASKRVIDMQDRVIYFTKEIVRALGYYLWHDPLIQLPLYKRVTGMEQIAVATNFNMDYQQGLFYEYNIDIEPYSMQHQSPQMKLQTITQVFQQFIAPFAPMMAEQGIGINFEALMKIIGKYSNVNELNEILEFAGPSIYDRPAVGSPPQKAGGTTRHISERVNRPGATRHGKDMAMAQALLGAAPQQDEMAAIGRPTG